MFVVKCFHGSYSFFFRQLIVHRCVIHKVVCVILDEMNEFEISWSIVNCYFSTVITLLYYEKETKTIWLIKKTWNVPHDKVTKGYIEGKYNTMYWVVEKEKGDVYNFWIIFEFYKYKTQTKIHGEFYGWVLWRPILFGLIRRKKKLKLYNIIYELDGWWTLT